MSEELGEPLVLGVPRTQLIRPGRLGPQPGQPRGDGLRSAVGMFPRNPGGLGFLNLRLLPNCYEALEMLVGSSVGHGSPDTAGPHQNSEPNIIFKHLEILNTEEGEFTWTWAGEEEEGGHSEHSRVSGRLWGPGGAPALSE